jgi:hypothetical protein
VRTAAAFGRLEKALRLRLDALWFIFVLMAGSKVKEPRQ